MDKIEQEIFETIQMTLQSDWENIDTKHWTKTIKGILCNIGSNHGFQPYSSICDSKHKEWLWDLIWCRENNNDWKSFCELELICEIEWWSIDEIRSDFQKLLVGNSKYRIMIAEYWSEGKHKYWEEIKQACIDASKTYRPQNFNYLLLCIPYDEKDKAIIHSYAWIQ